MPWRTDVTTFTFKVVETNRDGYIAYDAVEESTEDVMVLNVQQKIGTYQEIENFIRTKYSLNISVEYSPHLGDHYDKDRYTWTYVRGEHTVIVCDAPRTVFRLTAT